MPSTASPARSALFTTDSDAPDSNRIAYLGSSNTLAGVQAGEVAVKALPNGAKCMGFVGFLGADNAKERIAGFKQAVEGKGIELVDVRGDDVDFARARSNVDDVLAANPEINCMVGFYSYNPPKIYEALQAAGKLGQITVIAFDEDPITLGAVKDGSFAGTVVQQPFEWGYQGMKLMAAYLEGDKSQIPANKLIIVPTKVIDKANVDEFEANLRRRRSANKLPRRGSWGRPVGRPAPAPCLPPPLAFITLCCARRPKVDVQGAPRGERAMVDPFLQLTDITKTYPGVIALAHVSLSRVAGRGDRPGRRERRRQIDLDEDSGRRGGAHRAARSSVDGAERHALTVPRRDRAPASPSSIRNSTCSTISMPPPMSSSAASRSMAGPCV